MLEIRAIGSRLKTAFALRAEQAKVIANYISDSPYMVIVMGDFNDTPQSYAYRKIRRGNTDAFRKAGRGFGNTYRGELPSFRIDYIMHDEALVPYDFKRIKIDYSDHFPIITWLSMQEEPLVEQVPENPD
jgi:endonuclease/exonuclease/phosphatase (EEP) superfamily protein YafD